MNSYSHLARFYNILMQDCDYHAWSQFLIKHIPEGSVRGVDLACGTGSITNLLAQNFAMIGIDRSPEMLAVAQLAKAKAGNPVYVCMDMLTFELHKQTDFVTCVCDGVNYLNAAQTEKLFSRVADCLGSGKVFIFDISSEFKLRNVLAENVFAHDGDDLCYLWQNRQTKNGVEMALTFFEREGEVYRRFDEKHIQFAHNTDEVFRKLKKVGFDTVEMFDGYSGKAVKPDSHRVVYVCMKG